MKTISHPKMLAFQSPVTLEGSYKCLFVWYRTESDLISPCVLILLIWLERGGRQLPTCPHIRLWEGPGLSSQLLKAKAMSSFSLFCSFLLLSFLLFFPPLDGWQASFSLCPFSSSPLAMCLLLGSRSLSGAILFQWLPRFFSFLSLSVACPALSGLLSSPRQD